MVRRPASAVSAAAALLFVFPAMASAETSTASLLLNAVSCRSGDACMAVGQGPGGLAAEPWDGRQWSYQTVSNKVQGSLTAVSCWSGHSCMAVGARTSPQQNQLPISARWNGTAWRLESMPNPAPRRSTDLQGVSCSSARACIAVGDYDVWSSHGFTLAPLAERWNGRRWTIEAPPRPVRATYSTLHGVSCSSPYACIAVGYYFTRSAQLALVEGWNGRRWTIESVPRPARATDSSFGGVSCSSRNACTAVGFYARPHRSDALAERWNGRRWTIQQTLDRTRTGTDLSDVSCAAQHVCTAIGSFRRDGTQFAVAERWNGSRWTIQRLARSGGGSGTEILAAGASCGAVRACVAVFTYDYFPNTEGEFVQGVAERWNGRRWAVQKLGAP